MTRRFHYIDWLRVLAVLLLFPFHTSRVFNFGEPFYIKSAELSQALNYGIAFIGGWHMPLLFMLAGASAFLALAKRKPGRFVDERFTRLGIPLLFGILVLLPPQTYIGARFNSGYMQSAWHYIVSLDFLRWNIQPAGDYYGGFGVGHLWFILFLLLISLIALPFLLWARGERGSRRVAGWSRALARPVWWLLPPVVIFLADAAPAIAGKNLIYYLVFFVFGAIGMADDAFAEAAERHTAVALVLGVALGVAHVATGGLRDALPDPSWPLAAVNYLGMLGGWLMLIGLLGAGRRYLDAPSPALSYLAEASYPVYILHQTVIVVLAALIVRAPIGGVAQWLAILALSVVVTFALYEGVRRVDRLRYLFGMRSAK